MVTTAKARSLIAAAGVAAAAPWIAEGQPASASSEADAPALEEIVVTADRTG